MSVQSGGVRGNWRFIHLKAKLWNTLRINYHLGFTSFGGPPVHYKIFQDTFVQKLQWIDDQMFQELFSVCQAVSGPASTKMHYCINLVHNGFLSALLSFFIWSLPGALGMYGLAIGVSHIEDTLPGPVYALLSGLNASTVGIIAVAAVQLSEKAISNKTSRLLVLLGGTAGILYNALWYFPLLIFVAGCATVVHDYRWLHGLTKIVVDLVKNPTRRLRSQEPESTELSRAQPTSLDNNVTTTTASFSTTREHNYTMARSSRENTSLTLPVAENSHVETESEPRVVPLERSLNFSWRFSLGIIGIFLITFITVMVLRGQLPVKTYLFSFFANMYLAGTIIFGGGPVVIPLLREYVVVPGWVSPRDFLIGLAIQQSFPGPNFNFAVYLGALTAINGGNNSAFGAMLGFIGIFAPGLIIVHATMGIWSTVRGLRWVKSLLRGVNAGAVGLIYTAVYRLWQIGYIDESFQQGTSLAQNPWWVVVTASSFVFGYSFHLWPPVTIIMGAVFSLIWYAIRLT